MPKNTGAASSSVIAGAASRASRYLRKKLANGFFGSIFSSYGTLDDAFAESALAGTLSFGPQAKRVSLSIKNTVARAFEASYICNAFDRLCRYALMCRLAVYGVFLLAFGFYTAAAEFIASLVPSLSDGIDYETVYIGLTTVLASLPLLFSKKTLADSMLDGSMLDRFCSRALGIRRENIAALRAEERRRGRSNIAFVAGMLAGILTYALPPLYIPAVLLFAAAAALFARVPEVGVAAVFFCVPFLPTVRLGALLVYVDACYILKWLRGKRAVSFELIDLAVFAFACVAALGGVVAVDPSSAMKTAFVWLVFLSGWFLCAASLRTRSQINRCAAAIALGVSLTSLWGAADYFINPSSGGWLDATLFGDITSRAAAAFENPNMLATYLAMAAPFAAAALVRKERAAGSAGAVARFTSLAVTLLCLMLTWSRGAWLGFLCAAVFWLLVLSENAIWYLLLAAGCILLAPELLPATVVERFSSIGSLADSSTVYRLLVWRDSLRMAADRWFCGVGLGEGSFAALYPAYSSSGVTGAPAHSHNLFMQLVISFGAPGLIVFAVFIFIFYQMCFTGLRRKTAQRSDRLVIASSAAAVLAMLGHGSVDYVWYNNRVYMFFWLTAALGAAAVRVVRAEEKHREQDDRIY